MAETPIAQIKHLHRAIMEKAVAQICQSYVPQADTYVFVEGPRDSTLGYQNIAKGWQDFCDSSLTVDAIAWIEGPFTEVSESIAWVAGIVRLTITVNNQLIQRNFRATYILRKIASNQWQIQHEHVSAPLEDPYGIGDWLKQ